MAVSSEARKAAILAVLLVALAVVVVYRVRPALVAGVVSPAREPARIGSYEVPSLGLAPPATAPPAGERGARSLFTYGPAPTPTPDPRPTPTPLPTLPPRPVVIPTPPGIDLPDGRRLPPPPAFPLTFLGWLGPDRLRLGVFRDGGEVVVIPEGDTVKDRFILREVGPTTVTIGFVGYPESVTRKVPMSQ